MIQFYSLTGENYRNYLSDFDYYRLHPINGPYSKWIDDKLTLRYILEPFSAYLPEYYCHLSYGQVLRLMDCPEDFQETCQDIIKLLTSKRFLAAKLSGGSRGKGFFKLAYDGKEYSINDVVVSKQGIVDVLRNWLQTEDYLITEYVTSHKDLNKIFSESPAIVRVLVIRERGKPPVIAYAYVNIPTIHTGVTNNAVEGSVFCNVDVISGSFSDGKLYMLDDVLLDGKHHPDTQVLVEGVLPNWDLIKGKILQISNYIPQVRFMGIDLIITDDGFKIIEINSHPGLSFMQLYHPLLADETSKNFFTGLLAEK